MKDTDILRLEDDGGPAREDDEETREIVAPGVAKDEEQDTKANRLIGTLDPMYN
jgi:hypothetical protein